MQMNKIAVITGFLGSIRNRYMQYQPARTLDEKLKIASKIRGLDGLELCYPADFEDFKRLRSLLERYGLGVAGINFRSRRSGKWWRGSFTSDDPAERDEVIEDMKRAMDYAAELGCNRVTTCPLNEGHDYVFEMNYADAYAYAEESFARICTHNPEVRVCIEYKWSDPRTRCLLGNAGEVLSFCLSVGASNLGATLDFGHSRYAGERPAQAACLLARAGKLFYVHLNDNDGNWDWDMIPGAYNFWEFVEFFYYLHEVGYDDDWYACDVFSKEADTVATFDAVTTLIRKLENIASRIDEDVMKNLLACRNPSRTLPYLYSLI